MNLARYSSALRILFVGMSKSIIFVELVSLGYLNFGLTAFAELQTFCDLFCSVVLRISAKIDYRANRFVNPPNFE
jgi:hypothetical protein